MHVGLDVLTLSILARETAVNPLQLMSITRFYAHSQSKIIILLYIAFCVIHYTRWNVRNVKYVM